VKNHPLICQAGVGAGRVKLSRPGQGRAFAHIEVDVARSAERLEMGLNSVAGDGEGIILDASIRPAIVAGTLLV